MRWLCSAGQGLKQYGQCCRAHVHLTARDKWVCGSAHQWYLFPIHPGCSPSFVLLGQGVPRVNSEFCGKLWQFRMCNFLISPWGIFVYQCRRNTEGMPGWSPCHSLSYALLSLPVYLIQNVIITRGAECHVHSVLSWSQQSYIRPDGG